MSPSRATKRCSDRAEPSRAEPQLETQRFLSGKLKGAGESSYRNCNDISGASPNKKWSFLSPYYI